MSTLLALILLMMLHLLKLNSVVAAEPVLYCNMSNLLPVAASQCQLVICCGYNGLY